MLNTAQNNHNTLEPSQFGNLDFGKSKSASFFRILKESMVVRLKIFTRYRAEAVGSLVNMILLTFFFGMFATVIGFRAFSDFDQRAIFIFFLGGFLIMFFDGVAIWGPVRATNRDLYNGTLEQLYFVPGNKFPYYIGYSIGSVIVSSLLGFIPIFIFFVWYASIPLDKVIILLFVMGVLLLSLIAFGLIIGLSVILWKQTQSLVSLIGTVLQFMTGALVPLLSLPGPLQFLAYFFPHTWAYELIRYYTIPNWPLIVPLWANWVLILLFFSVYVLLALYLHKKVIKHAKTRGLHLL